MELLDRLDNWARFYRTRYGLKSCGSAEKKYRSPWRQWVPLSDIQISGSIDIQDAEKVEYAWRALDKQGREVIRLTYIYKSPDYIVARQAGIKRWHLEEAHKGFLSQMQKILDRV